MPQKMKDIVRMGLQVDLATPAGSFPLHAPFEGSGLKRTLTQHTGTIEASSGWPYTDDEVNVGNTAALEFTPQLNINTIRDMVRLITLRTPYPGRELYPITIKHSQSGVRDLQFNSCLCNSLNLEFSSSGQPDRSAVLSGTMGFACMETLKTATEAVTPGTQPTGHRFQLRHSIISLDGTVATAVMSYRQSITVTLSEGRPDPDNRRIYLESQNQKDEITMVVHFNSAEYQDKIHDEVEMASSFIQFATGFANETFNFVFPRSRLVSDVLNEDAGTTVAEITLRPYTDGTNPHSIVQWGGAIGPSLLGLPNEP